MANDAATVTERLRVLSDCIEAMRAATPAKGRRAKAEVRWNIAKAYDQMVTELIVCLGRWVAPLELDIPEDRYRPPGCVTLVCRWAKKQEGQR